MTNAEDIQGVGIMLLGIMLLFWNYAAAIFRNYAGDWNYAAVFPEIKPAA